jgi:hypothetical protein
MNIRIPADEYQRLYQGVVRDVSAQSIDGRRIRFPAMILRPYVTHQGIKGRFRLVFDELNRFQTIEKID